MEFLFSKGLVGRKINKKEMLKIIVRDSICKISKRMAKFGKRLPLFLQINKKPIKVNREKIAPVD
jgi:hypothetical protein